MTTDQARHLRVEAALTRQHARYLEAAGKDHNSPPLLLAASMAYRRAEDLETAAKEATP